MMRKLVLPLALVALLAAALPAHAVQPGEMLPDPAQEARARALSRELRCMVCQNQSIDDSEAPLARDLRVLVRERIKAGDDDRQVIDYLVARYGEFVLMRPSWHGANVLLWTTPLLVLLGGGVGIWVMMRRRRAGSAAATGTTSTLSPDEEKRLRALLGDDEARITKV